MENATGRRGGLGEHREMAGLGDGLEVAVEGGACGDDPVGAGDESVERGVVGVDEQVGDPAVVAAEGEGVAVEEYDAGDVVWVRASVRE